MAKQNVNLGTAPSGAGGDTFRSGTVKLQANDDEIYGQLGADKDGKLPTALPINKGGTGAATAAAARTSLGITTGLTPGSFITAQSALDYSSLNPVSTGGIGGSGIMTSSAPRGKHNAAGDEGADTRNGFYSQPSGSIDAPTTHQSGDSSIVASWGTTFSGKVFFSGYRSKGSLFFRFIKNGNHLGWNEVYGTNNTGVDSNGFIKAASPIVQLFADHIELNDEAKEQSITLEKLGIGDYRVKGSLGFAQEGWYIEQPKDANGNVLVAVVYEQLENNDISVKTYKKKFDFETASIVADLDKPVDIPQGRWIDLRLQELSQPLIEMEEELSNTPFNFQPTGIAQAVQEMMYGTE